MPKKRVYELAKEMGLQSSEIMKILAETNAAVKNHFASLEESDVAKVAQYLESRTGNKVDKAEKKATENKPEPKASSEEAEKKSPKNEQEKEHRMNKAEEGGGLAAPAETSVQNLEGSQRPERPVRLGPDGKPLPRRERPLGPDGQPLPRPVRLGPDGKPLPRRERPLGPDGKPLPRPVRLGPDGKPLPRRERPLGPDGKPLPRPERPMGAGQPAQRPRPDGQRPDNRTQRTDRPYNQGQSQGNRYQGSQGQGNRSQSGGYQGQNRQGYQGQNQGQGQNRQGGYQGQSQGNRSQGQGGYQGGNNRPRPAGQMGQSGDRPAFRSGDRDKSSGFSGGFSGGADKGRSGSFNKNKNNNQKAQETPDKHGRRQKIEIGAKKDKRRDRPDDDSKEKMLSRNITVKTPSKPEEPKVIQVPAVLTLKELAELMNKQGAELVKALMKKGDMISINQEIPYEKAEEIALDYNILVEPKIEIDILEEVFHEDEEDDSILAERPPVVVVMGHVDHGKTSLLDSIRKTDVVHGEAGGITQHIGAYTVSINDRPITFLDTPGHEAFTAMRMRGAQVTDIAVLVVAADDGVMPQTVEAISHAKAAGVEIIVAINKIDKPSANPDRVMQELTEHGLVSEAWGGETICVPVSAATKEGIDTLLEMIILVADLREYKANANKRARGTIIEAQLDKGRGPVATVLVKSGTLRIGDPIVAGTAHGKIRAMINDKGQKVLEATPSIPVEILGLHSVPTSGDLFHIARDEREARYVAETIIAKNRVKLLDETPQKVSLDDLFSQIQAGKVKELNIIIKADVGGSVEAVKASLEKLSNEEVRIRTILGGVGAVTESDVMLASASNAIIIGFNVRPEPSAKSVAEEQQVDIRLYRIIYNAIDDIQAAMVGMLDPIFEEKVIGHAKIRQIFKASGIGTIGGAYVTDGRITRNASVRVLRDNIVVYEGTLDTLRRFKDDVREVLTNYECGLVLNKFNDIKEGDVVEAFVMEEIKR